MWLAAADSSVKYTFTDAACSRAALRRDTARARTAPAPGAGRHVAAAGCHVVGRAHAEGRSHTHRGPLALRAAVVD
jgi:hypothetical protein